MSATVSVGTAIPSPCSGNSPDAPGRFTSRNTKIKLSRVTFTKKYFTSAKPVPAPNGTSSKWAVRKETASKCPAKFWKSYIALESEVRSGMDVHFPPTNRKGTSHENKPDQNTTPSQKAYPAQVRAQEWRGRRGLHYRAAACVGRPGICCAQREDYSCVYRVRHAGAQRNAANARNARAANCRRVRPRQGRPRLCGLVQRRVTRLHRRRLGET